MFWPPEIIAAMVVIGVAAIVFVVLRRRATAWPVQTAEPEADRAAHPPAATLRESLTNTRHGLLARLESAWGAGKNTELRLAELEEVLLTADVGLKATQALLGKLRPRARELTDANVLRRALRHDMRAVLADAAPTPPAPKPYVILVAGVNGVGKTTTVGKLAHRYRETGKKVLLIAADTFRAAASEQMEHWARRVGADCVRHQSGADPSAVVFDGLKAAVARDLDVVIIDTAGRLHVRTNLIEELRKIVRVISRQLDGAPHEVLLVVDATTGQNAIRQARVFQEALSLTGIILTKLDGTAKGGAAFAVRAELGIPIRYVGLGEGVADLTPFDADAFVDALLTPNDGPPARSPS
jgi:fused signal recognition particle receptor